MPHRTTHPKSDESDKMKEKIQVKIDGDEAQYELIQPLMCIDKYVDGINQTFYMANLKKTK